MGTYVQAAAAVFSANESRKSRKDAKEASKQLNKAPPPEAQQDTSSTRSSSRLRAKKRQGVAASVLSGQDAQSNKTTLG